MRAFRAQAHMYLDPCQWPSPASAVTVNATTSVQASLPLKRGVFLVVHFEDPSGIVSNVRANDPVSAKLPGPPVTVSITDASGMARLTPFGSTVGGVSQFKLLVPPGSSIALGIGGSKVLLADSAGAPVIPGSYSLALDIPALGTFQTAAQSFPSPLRGNSVPAVDVHFTVTGVSP